MASTSSTLNHVPIPDEKTEEPTVIPEDDDSTPAPSRHQEEHAPYTYEGLQLESGRGDYEVHLPIMQNGNEELGVRSIEIPDSEGLEEYEAARHKIGGTGDQSNGHWDEQDGSETASLLSKGTAPGESIVRGAEDVTGGDVGAENESMPVKSEVQVEEDQKVPVTNFKPPGEFEALQTAKNEHTQIPDIMSVEEPKAAVSGKSTQATGFSGTIAAVAGGSAADVPPSDTVDYAGRDTSEQLPEDESLVDTSPAPIHTKPGSDPEVLQTPRTTGKRKRGRNATRKKSRGVERPCGEVAIAEDSEQMPGELGDHGHSEGNRETQQMEGFRARSEVGTMNDSDGAVFKERDISHSTGNITTDSTSTHDVRPTVVSTTSYSNPSPCDPGKQDVTQSTSGNQDVVSTQAALSSGPGGSNTDAHSHWKDGSSPLKSQGKEAIMAELKTMKMASLQSRNTTLLSELSCLRGKLAITTSSLTQPPAHTLKTHIHLLHAYNDIKDIGQGLLGMIAESRDVRVVDVMAEFGVGGGD